MRQWVLSLPHALRFLLATDPAALTQVLGVVYRTIARYLISQAGLTRTRAATGAVTLIQRFGSALNLNIHLHILFLDGVHLFKGAHPPKFRPVTGPSANELQRLVEQIGAQVGQVLERRGLIERDIDNSWLATGLEAGPLADLIGHSITYRIAMEPRAGQKLFTRQTVLPRLQELDGDANGAARAGGFSLHAGQPEVIAKILAHLERTASPRRKQPEVPLGARAPPVPSRLR